LRNRASFFWLIVKTKVLAMERTTVILFVFFLLSVAMCSLHSFSSVAISFRTQKYVNTSLVHRLSPIGYRNYPLPWAVTSIDEIPPNAVRRKIDRNWRGGFSLGVDLGLSRTGIAISKGYTVKPLTVLKSRGQKLETRLLEIAEEEEADEFIIGLPRSSDGKETIQSNKIRSVAGRLAIQAAERGWRVCHVIHLPSSISTWSL
jgi:putative Holliday junction resolvase